MFLGAHTIYVRQDWLELISKPFRLFALAVIWFMGEMTTTTTRLSERAGKSPSSAHFTRRERLTNAAKKSKMSTIFFFYHHRSLSSWFFEWKRSIALIWIRWSSALESVYAFCNHLRFSFSEPFQRPFDGGERKLSSVAFPLPLESVEALCSRLSDAFGRCHSSFVLSLSGERKLEEKPRSSSISRLQRVFHCQLGNLCYNLLNEWNHFVNLLDHSLECRQF